MITLTIADCFLIGAALISFGSLVAYVKQSRDANRRAFERIETIEKILIGEGLMEVPEGTQTGHEGRGVRRPRGLPNP